MRDVSKKKRSKGLCRRQVLKGSAALGAALLFAPSRRVLAAPGFEVLDLRTISHQASLYHGWPTLARRHGGELLLVYSGGRETHVCPFGRVEMMRSHDDGTTWSWPRVLIDTAIDDRDAGVVETASGAILVTTFTSLAWESSLARAEKDGSWSAEKLGRWRTAARRLDATRRRSQLGVWFLRSHDDGCSWSELRDSTVNSPHGPTLLCDGSLLYAGKELWRERARNGVCRSTDDGASWQWIAEIPTRPGDDPKNYHELHCVETTPGHIVVHIRNHNKANQRETLQSESEDAGTTWSVPHPIGVWGLPSHLLRLRDGRILMTYGHRRKPIGNQARISSNSGRTWSDAMILDDKGYSSDLGYPSTVELDDGSLLSVWYERLASSPRAVLRQAHWRLES